MKTDLAWRWWHMSLIPELKSQRQVHLCEFETSMAYRVISRTGSKATQIPTTTTTQKAKKGKEKETDLGTKFYLNISKRHILYSMFNSREFKGWWRNALSGLSSMSFSMTDVQGEKIQWLEPQLSITFPWFPWVDTMKVK